ncbi:acetyl/propionyl/methylcrotonyl-CoA carboxylase subunit alpha [Buchananella hordeovulneris]|uniref:Acetyl-/propionyl-CoA carboxylase subunit alpha n=1 Tax=Buchananella hordeovulneris TaxID=52770 RepID=A0A1Q5PW87_9ACTO|nr:biotin carboxylase N-terminal domain-containing protein [Buchananella hordeovulneris]OKL51883.1 acetyl-/propionyl-CoA carboxylase subunit alpha [Buchananella hordeovulneris]
MTTLPSWPRSVLIANRGEIAVRVARACADAGLKSIGVYAAPDRDALHTRMVDEAFALPGSRPADTYLNIEAILAVAERSGASAVHPGYGFLAENAEFARAVIAAGLVWIGPPPAAIEALGDKVTARRIAAEVGAPLAPGTPGPVAGPQEVLDFVAEHGLPVAIKAAFGGGGRGLRVARTQGEVVEAFEAAAREAVAAFGRGECFVERYLDRPRHVETQCLADQYGNVAVVSTRDCSLQRRHQKLLEEAPAPFLTAEQEQVIEESSRNILRRAGYVGAGTCEFLVAADGLVSFLEVNTRLQVEHPVTEEITGIDLVREQIRLAAGEELGYTQVQARGHAVELRLNAEDPARGFLPTPGKPTALTWPAGPGVRIDAGIAAGDELSGLFDSLVAKVIVWGPTREIALARARRAVRETHISGLTTTLPFHAAVLRHPAFTAEDGFGVDTTWIDSGGLDLLRDQLGEPGGPATALEDEAATERLVVEVGGKRLEVILPAGLMAAPRAASVPPAAPARPSGRRGRGGRRGSAGGPGAVTCPMQATVIKVEVSEGQAVEQGQTLVVIEAMKMEQPITAPRTGLVQGLAVSVGTQVASGGHICDVIEG